MNQGHIMALEPVPGKSDSVSDNTLQTNPVEVGTRQVSDC